MNEASNHCSAVRSRQRGLHPKLAAAVVKHLGQPFRKPYAAHTLVVFERLGEVAKPVVLDAGCGTGESTVRLAERHPDALVIGVDKSIQRLARRPVSLPANCLLLRADLIDFWRLCAAAGWRLERHYLLYPNPWPKARQFKRRWHASAVFPAILQLGGQLELRCNWPIYVAEFAQALSIAGYPARVERFIPDSALSPFERKYRARRQGLWKLQVNLNTTGSVPSGQRSGTVPS